MCKAVCVCVCEKEILFEGGGSVEENVRYHCEILLKSRLKC